MYRYIADAWSLYDTISIDMEQYSYFDLGWWEGYALLIISIEEEKLILRVSLDVEYPTNTNYMEGLRIWFKSQSNCPYNRFFEIELRPELELEFHTDRHDSYQCVIVI
jgi:hypothetical protein